MFFFIPLDEGNGEAWVIHRIYGPHETREEIHAALTRKWPRWSSAQVIVLEGDVATLPELLEK